MLKVAIGIVTIVLIFTLSADSHADRWNNKWFSSFGIRVQQADVEHNLGYLELAGDVSTGLLNFRFGKAFSRQSAFYVQGSSSVGAVEHMGAGLMFKPIPRRTLFLFGDVGVVTIGGPYAITAGAGIDFSRVTLDIAGQVSGGDEGNGKAVMITIAYLWTQK